LSNKQKGETPDWKEDFPIDQEEATHVSRREFAKFLGLFSGALALGNGAIVLRSIAFPEKELEGQHFICNTQDVAIGEMTQFEIAGTKTIPYILIHLEDGEWRAFEQKCTHLACAVRYRADLDQIECPCHKGYFDARTGVVIQGPPPRPLPQLEVVVEEDKVYVKSLHKEKPYNL
jgi:Rieske Fe-S protein